MYAYTTATQFWLLFYLLSALYGWYFVWLTRRAKSSATFVSEVESTLPETTYLGGGELWVVLLCVVLPILNTGFVGWMAWGLMSDLVE